MAEIDVDALLQDPRTEIGAKPIGDGGAGDDMRDDPDYDALETEFRKMESGGPLAVDWTMVTTKGLDIIENRSKDLVLGSRVAYGLQRLEGYKGLAIGLSIMKGMIADHWEDLFPPKRRERGRGAGFDWLAEKAAQLVETSPPEADQQSFALVAHDRLVEVDDILTEKFEKHEVTLGPLIRLLRPIAKDARNVLEEAAQKAEEAEAEAAAPPSGTAPAAETAASSESEAQQPAPAEAAAPAAPTVPQEQAPRPETAAPPQPVGEPAQSPAAPMSTEPASVPAAPPPAVADIVLTDGLDKALQSLFDSAVKVANAAHREAPADPRAYLAARFATWGKLTALPPERDGKTPFPPPRRQALNGLENVRGSGDHAAVLAAAEAAFPMTPLWLDAQYYVVKAMEGLGNDYDAARLVVVGELAALLKRFPSVPKMAFNSGMPFADPETTSWINAEVLAGDGGGGAAGDGKDLASKVAEASKLGQSGKLLDGLEILGAYADGCFGERERFVAQLEIGEFCLRFNLVQQVLALVQKLDDMATTRALALWEPQLAVQLASLRWRALGHRNAAAIVGQKEAQDERTRVMSVLAELDMSTAARLAMPSSR